MENNNVVFIVLGVLLISAVSSWNLTGEDVTVLTGEEAVLVCQVTPPENTTDTPIRVWKDVHDEYIYFVKTIVQADKDRMSVSINDNTMSFTIKSVRLEDENLYRCGLNAINPTVYFPVQLTVNQYPQEIYITDYEDEPVDGVEATVAKCFAKGAKPKPIMWFTDANGYKVDVSGVMEESEHENGVVDGALSLTTVFTKDNHQMVYKCHVKRADGTVKTKETTPIKVRYAASAHLFNVVAGEHKLLEESQRFEATCSASGYPVPIVQWIFEPDEDTNNTIDQYWPENFYQSSDGRTITAEKLSVTDETSTNNGTFTCKASNGVGDPVSLSFRLGVYAVPITTVPTIPALADSASELSEATVAAVPHSAGSNAAVIGGVVAVAAFVVIVAVILIARYCMSHKGTYRTNEKKSHEIDEEKMSDDHPMVGEDDDDLGDISHKKRTEYFM